MIRDRTADRDAFEDCLYVNDVIPTREQWTAETKHAKLLLKTDQPAAYVMLHNDA